MKINLIEVPTPMITCFGMFSEPKLDILIEKKTVRVVASQETKTRISTTMQFGEYRVKINFKADGIKTHEHIGSDMFSGERYVSNYFVKSSKQALNEYKNYVTKVVEEVIKRIFKVDLDELTVELQIGGF